MPRTLTRRTVLKLGLASTALAACAPALPATRPAAAPAAAEVAAPVAVTAATEVELAQAMAGAAQALLAALDDPQRAKAAYAFDDAERVRWHWTTPRNFPRNGLPLTEMSAEQKTLAHALLAASVASAGYAKAVAIMALQSDLGNDPELYYVTLFGTPGEGAWGWRWEGHHLSRHFTVVDGQVVMTPFFLGAWPTVNGAGERAMPREEDAALELVTSLGAPAIFQENTLTRHVTQNDARVQPLDPVGVEFAAMTDAQQQLVVEIVETYLAAMPPFMAAAQRARIDAAGLDAIRFGWAGPLELRRPTYYRLQGPTFLLEHDKSRNGGTHIHSVWRDFERDFGMGGA
ncbi:MAG: DUF3500 domain-containing protein [Caldilineaceae bacterium]|nr:DUF3500 domain-containing protein [Caldilineaceae bacterium]MCB9122914.1 DUF3500 domain-containing protein [Caldilineaceae bacterium]